MKKLYIYEPAMCCSTGLCGVSVNPELLRISTVFNHLTQNGVQVTRYNLSSSPRAFMTNRTVNQIVKTKGVKALPITIVDNEIVKMEEYPTNEEIARFLGVTEDYLCMEIKDVAACDCSDGSCCK